MKVVAFTGMPGSGKSEAVAVVKNLGIPVIRMGDSVWEEVSNRNLEINDDNVGRIADEMRKTQGMNIWARRTIEKINPDEDIVVIDGVRNIEEVDLFKKRLDKDFSLVAIHASPETRHRRLLRRKRKDDTASLERIQERDKRELNWGIEILNSLADVVVVNEGNLSEFKSRIEEVLQSV